MNNMPTIAGWHARRRAQPGTWRIDPVHSSVSFSVRHLMSKVRGRFLDARARIENRLRT